jgi:hypothetical protein
MERESAESDSVMMTASSFHAFSCLKPLLRSIRKFESRIGTQPYKSSGRDPRLQKLRQPYGLAPTRRCIGCDSADTADFCRRVSCGRGEEQDGGQGH